jgi:hypothetical protein
VLLVEQMQRLLGKRKKEMAMQVHWNDWAVRELLEQLMVLWE